MGIAALVIGLGLLAEAFMWRDRREKGCRKDDAPQSMGITLVILGIVFGEDPLIGHSFIGAGILLSVASLFIRRRQGKA